jgi:hypothetical protein
LFISVGSIFPEKLIFDEKKYRTASINELIAIILSNHAGFRKLEIKKPRRNGEVSKKAPPLGLEPIPIAIGTLINRHILASVF